MATAPVFLLPEALHFLPSPILGMRKTRPLIADATSSAYCRCLSPSEIIIKYNGTLERYAGDGVMVVFNDRGR